jgi:drug/metabolite transporter (DMT)-like permease
MSIALGVIASKRAYAEGADTHSILSARLILAAALVVPLVPWSIRASGRRASFGAVALGLGTGVALCVGGRSELEGLARLPAGTLVLLLAAVPVWVAGLGWLGVGRSPTRVERAAVAALVTGVAIMAVPIGAAIDPLGLAFGIATTLCFTVFLLALERNRGVAPRSGFLLGVAGAGLALIAIDPGALPGLVDGEVPLPLVLALGVTTAGWAVLVGIGLQATDSVTAAIVISVEPVLVAVLAFLLLGEGLSPRELVGGLVVLSAIGAVAVHPADG